MQCPTDEKAYPDLLKTSTKQQCKRMSLCHSFIFPDGSVFIWVWYNEDVIRQQQQISECQSSAGISASHTKSTC